MERKLVVWCPGLIEQQEQGREARVFVRVVAAVGEFSPGVDVVRAGVCALGTRGPSRYFGGDDALARLVARRVGTLQAAGGVDLERGARGEERTALLAGVGIADGLFAATLAARSALEGSPHVPVVVGPGSTPEFLAPWPVTVLDRPELADLLLRLGIDALGGFARLPARDVLARFGRDGALCHAVAAGEQGDLPDLGASRSRARQRSRPGREPPAVARQVGFFGADAGAEARARRAVEQVQHLLHPEAVVRGHLQGGRGPAERARLVPWGEHRAGALTILNAGLNAGEGTSLSDSLPAGASPRGRFRGNVSAGSAPWPGQLPSPSPIVVLGHLLPAELVDAQGDPVRVTTRGMTSVPPALLSLDGGPWWEVSCWAGPWPAEERWWSKRGRRRQARMQVLVSGGAAYLLVCRGRWWVEGVYD